MYKITLHDGTVLDELELNGNNFISEKVIDDSVFSGNLDTVTISNGETTETYTDMKLLSNRVDGGKSWFVLSEKTEQEKTMERLVSALSVTFVALAESGGLDEVTASEHAELFAPWAYPVAYTAGQLRRYNGTLYKCVQAHTSQADWTPDTAVSLWIVAADPAEEWPAWSQPIGAHDAYAKGDKVSHNGKPWASNVDSNVWEPGVYGWTEYTE